MAIHSKVTLRINGMTCAHCQQRIEEGLRELNGVKSAAVSWSKGTAAVVFDGALVSRERIEAAIEELGYQIAPNNAPESKSTAESNPARLIGLLIIIAALYIILEHFGILNLLSPSRVAEAGMGYGMLFIIGLVTSVHCVAMCGGINLSQSMAGVDEDGGRFAAFRPTALYNLGRVIAYTAVGFTVGALGAVVSPSSGFQGALKLIAGVFMIIMGVNMLGLFPWLRRFNIRMPRIFQGGAVRSARRSGNPFVVGLLNGLMPCGPLQAMQLYALSTGNPFAGALSMFLFSLGTVPLMFGLGALSGAMGRRFTQRAMTVGAVLVVTLGLSMLTQGWSLAGVGLPRINSPIASNPASTAAPVDMGGGNDRDDAAVQTVRSQLTASRYPAITVEARKPVKWIIDAPNGSLNGCNYRMVIPAFNLQFQFQTGENVIEFTPTAPGNYAYSCWMGMIRGTITVTE